MHKITLIALFIIAFLSAKSQQYHFSFAINSPAELNQLTRVISIDKVAGNTVEAFANTTEMAAFISLGYKYRIIEKTQPKVINMATTIEQMANWDRYPTYEVYVAMMQNFAATYPQLCTLQEIGTLASGRKLLAIKISDNVNNNNENEPELLYTGTMHGDETTGFLLLLRLADYLLSNYGNPNFTNVNNLVNNTEIWINPAANPDGTYYGGNSTVSGSQRYNGNNVDLNRNFPDPGLTNPSPDNCQPENQMMIAFAESHNFVLAANFHGGAEVMNYPWDTWSRLPADANWWERVCRNYATTVQNLSPAGYFTDLNNGVTNGYAWYSVYGGRQDYMNYYHHCREVTIELSSDKLLSTDQLNNFWNYNKDALINYLLESLNGLRGVVTNQSGLPLNAKIEVVGHEADNSWSVTDHRAGDYYRYLKAGNYSVKFSANGYVDKIIDNVIITDGAPTILNVVLGYPEPVLSVDRNSINTNVVLGKTVTENITLTNVGFAPLNYSIAINNAENFQWITLNSQPGVLTAGQSQLVTATINTTGLDEKDYNCNIVIAGDTNLVIPVKVTVYTIAQLSVNKASLNKHILINQTATDTLIVANIGNANLNYSLNIVQPDNNKWLNISKNSGIVLPASADTVIVSFNPDKVGYSTTNIVISGNQSLSIPVTLHTDTLPYFKLSQNQLNYNLLITDSITPTISIKNVGGDTLNYTCTFSDKNQPQWLILPNNTSGKIASGNQTNMQLTINCHNLNKGNYSTTLAFYSVYDTVFLPVNLNVDTLPKFWYNNKNYAHSLFEGKLVNDTIKIANIGGHVLSYAASVQYTNSNNWLFLSQTEGQLATQQNKDIIFTIDAKNLAPGQYSANIVLTGSDSTIVELPVTVTVIKNATLSLNVVTLSKSTDYKSSVTDTLLLSNIGGGQIAYTLEFTTDINWATISKKTGIINQFSTDTIIVYFNALNIDAGSYDTKLSITTNEQKRIPVKLLVRSMPSVYIAQTDKNFTLSPGQTQNSEFVFTNTGQSVMYYNIFANNNGDWLNITSEKQGQLLTNQQATINYSVTAQSNTAQQYVGQVTIESLVNNQVIETKNCTVTLNNLTWVDYKDETVLKTWPNPFTNSVNITIPANLNQNYNLKVLNALGIVVYSLGNINNTVFEWDGTNNLGMPVEKGMYFIIIGNGTKQYTSRVIKQ